MRLRDIILLLSLCFLVSCAPVLTKGIMETGVRDFSLADLKKNPDIYRDKLYVFGGVIISTKGTAEGSLIEGIFTTVDSRGYLRAISTPQGRFLALFPRASGFLDPEIFSKDREITLAAEFEGIREGKIDEMGYNYPFFVIREVYLWKEETEYYPYYPYYPGYYYDPYPYYWGYPYYWNRPWGGHWRYYPYHRWR